MIFMLLQWFGTETILSLRDACIADKNKNSLGSTWEPVPVEESNWMKLNFSTEIYLF